MRHAWRCVAAGWRCDNCGCFVRSFATGRAAEGDDPVSVDGRLMTCAEAVAWKVLRS